MLGLGLYYLLFFLVTSLSMKVGVRLAVVNCADFPDVCMAYNVSTYPTVLYRLVVCVNRQSARNLV